MLSFHYLGLFALFAASGLLIAVSVSVPVWHSVYFLHADLGEYRTTETLVDADCVVDVIPENTFVTMGNWGVCFGDTCSKTRIG